MNQCGRAINLGKKKVAQDVSLGVSQASKAWNSLLDPDANGLPPPGPPGHPYFDAGDGQHDYYSALPCDTFAVMARARRTTALSHSSALAHGPQGPATVAALLNANNSAALSAQQSTFQSAPLWGLNSVGAEPLSQLVPQPLASSEQPTRLPTPPAGPSSAQPPNVEEQIQCLPKHLFDSDSDSDAPSALHAARGLQLPRPPEPDPSLAVRSGPCVPQRPASTSATSLTSSLSLPNGNALSAVAAPFVPRNWTGFTMAVQSTHDLLLALMQAVSLDHLHALLMTHAKLMNAECVLAAMQRLLVLYPTGAPLSDYHIVASRIMHVASAHYADLAPAGILDLLSGLLIIEAPFDDASRSLLHAAAVRLPPSPSLHTLLTSVRAIDAAQASVPSGSAEALRLTEDSCLVAHAAVVFLASVPAHEVPLAALAPLAAVMHNTQYSSLEALQTLAAAAVAHADALPPDAAVAVLAATLSNHAARDGELAHLARAFHLRQDQWTLQSALGFFSLCRSFKPLLAAQRRHSSLLTLLDFLEASVTECSTEQLATLLLDMAFIGCQSFKSHGFLQTAGDEMYRRVQSGRVSVEDAISLADAIKALDKLDHCHDGLSAAAGPVLAQSYAARSLPAKHLANVVVSLAKQRHLAPSLADCARDILEQHLDACNGQDVSQLLFGLMLDKNSGLATVQTYAAVAPVLARELRYNSTFQAQSVSRILSSYAKVGCYAPAVFAAGVHRMQGNALLQLKPAYVSELAWSLATAGYRDPAFMQHIGDAIKRRFSDYSQSMLCSALWSFPNAGTFHAELFSAACSKLAMQLSRRQLTAADVSQAMTGVRQSNFRHPGLLRAVQDWLQTAGDQTPAHLLASVLFSLHFFGMAPDRLLARLEPALAASLPACTPADKPRLVQMLATYAGARPQRASEHGGRGGSSANGSSGGAVTQSHFAESVLQHLIAVGGAQGLCSSDLAMLVRALRAVPASSLSDEDHAALLSGVALEAELCLDSAQAVQLVPLAAYLLEHPATTRTPALLSAMERRIAAAASTLDPPTLVEAMQAYASAAAPADSLMGAGARALCDVARVHQLPGVLASRAAWALALQGHSLSPVIAQLCAVAEDDMAKHADIDTYHMRRSGPALGPQELQRLHVVDALAHSMHDATNVCAGSWQSAGTLLGNHVTGAAREAYGSAWSRLSSGQRRSNANRQVLARCQQALTNVTRQPASATALRLPTAHKLPQPLLDAVDVHGRTLHGQPVAVLICRAGAEGEVLRCAGWLHAAAAALRLAVPELHAVVVPECVVMDAAALSDCLKQELCGHL